MVGDGGYSALGRDFDLGSRLTRRHTAQYTSWGMFSYLGVPSMYGVPSMFSVVTVFEIWLPRAGWCLQSDAVILCPMHVFRYGKFQISFGPAFLAFFRFRQRPRRRAVPVWSMLRCPTFGSDWRASDGVVSKTSNSGRSFCAIRASCCSRSGGRWRAGSSWGGRVLLAWA